MKFYWNTATPIHLHIIYTAFKLQRHLFARDLMTAKLKIFLLWPFIGSLSTPDLMNYIHILCIVSLKFSF